MTTGGAAPEGDELSFTELYREHFRWVSDYVYRRTGDLHATEDVVSETFLSVLRNLNKFEKRGIPLRFWLLRIASNEVNHWVRKQRRPMRAVADIEACSPQASCADPDAGSEQQDLERAQRAMLCLPKQQQDVLSLHYFEGLSVKEVAQVLRCREGSVKSALARGREALRLRLERQEEQK